jgi:hypothetical protein
MFTQEQLLSLEKPCRETLYRSVYQMYLYADAGGPLEKAALEALATMRSTWGMSDEEGAALEQKTNQFLKERSELLKGAGHYSVGIEPPSLH